MSVVGCDEFPAIHRLVRQIGADDGHMRLQLFPQLVDQDKTVTARPLAPAVLNTPDKKISNIIYTS
jgi:hypothetical protein